MQTQQQKRRKRKLLPPAQKTQCIDTKKKKGLKLAVKKLSPDAILPKRSSALAVGYDLHAACDSVITKHNKALIKTNLAIKIPDGHYGRMAPRSGLASKHFIDVGAGVIDPDYRGEVFVLLFNHNDQDFYVKAGDRIAQLIIEKCSLPLVEEVNELDQTERGEGAFGSTGV